MLLGALVAYFLVTTDTAPLLVRLPGIGFGVTNFCFGLALCFNPDLAKEIVYWWPLS
ncbi:MAG: hypothetical protein JWL89_285 [Candidatus Saccharibacteria bacterium]|nr:hypothetical protein [Candidatus Saccharibacteria bacterium]